VRLIRIHCPPCRKFVSLFQFSPACFFYHKLSSNLCPTLLPINPCIKNLNSDVINSSVISYQSKPTGGHSPKFVFILNKTIIIKFIFIERSLLIKDDWIGGSQFFYWYDRLFYSFDFGISLNMPFKCIEKETIGAFFYFRYLNILWLWYWFPMLSILH